jgi:hypothetical protein
MPFAVCARLCSPQRQRFGDDSLTRQVFWGPMAVSIMGGLVVATLLTCLFLPALYAAWFRVKEEQTL